MYYQQKQTQSDVVNMSERMKVDLFAHERFGHIGEKKMKLLGLETIQR